MTEKELNKIDADKRRRETRELTKKKRETQIIKTYTVKIQDNKLNDVQRNHLFMMFVEAKWTRNYILSLSEQGFNIFEMKDKDIKNITHLDKDRNIIPVIINHLPAQPKQDLLKSVKSEIKGLNTKKKDGEKVGALKYKSDHTSINFKQFGDKGCFSFVGKDKIKIAGIKKPIKVLGMGQLEGLRNKGLNYEVASGKLLKLADGYYFSITIAIDNDYHWQNLLIEKERKIIDKVGLDFGCSTTLTVNNGEKFNVRVEETERYKKLQQKIARSKEGSNNRYKLVKQLKKEALKISRKKDAEALKQKLIDTIELDFVTNKVTQKEDEKVEKVQKTKEDEIRDRLRSFTRTIPMFIMANDSKEEITIDNFDLEIDDNDFLELTSITKEEFHKLRDGFDYEEDGERKTFQGVFNKYRFNASIAEFRLKKDQFANYFTAEEDIFELIPNQKTNQIFTPRNVVKMMIDQLEEHDPTLFTRTDSTFIDLYMKLGMYITEIVKKLFNNTREHYNSDEDCLKHILENQVYGLAPTPILHGITQSYIFGFDVENKISRNNFVQHDITPEAKEGKAKEKLQELFNLKENMKFDAVVGNPPYNGENGQQIYPNFYVQGKEIGMNLCMIFPVGWQEPKNANNLSVLNKEEIKTDQQIVYIDNIQNAFPNVAGAEWTNIILWTNGYNNGFDGKQKILLNGLNPEIKKLIWNKDDISKPYEIKTLADIVVKSKDFKSLQESTSPAKPYGLRTDFLKDTRKYNLPPVQDTRLSETDIELWTGGRSGRLIKYIPIDYPLPKKTKAFDKYKVFVPYAWGNMSEGSGLGGAYSDIIIAFPNVATTETWQESGQFETFELAQKHAKFLMTRFTRALLYLNKHSQHSTRAWGAVPNQDYTESWWDESIEQLENRLFEKYGIPEDIRKFVIENIQQKSESNIVNFNNG